MPTFQFTVVHRATNSVVEPIEADGETKDAAKRAAYEEIAFDNEMEYAVAEFTYGLEDGSPEDVAELLRQGRCEGRDAGRENHLEMDYDPEREN